MRKFNARGVASCICLCCGERSIRILAHAQIEGQLMRFLANESFPAPSITVLRKAGYDVTAIREDAPGGPDRVAMRLARQEPRSNLPCDRDPGELIYRLRLPSPGGEAYFRFKPVSPTGPAEVSQRILNGGIPSLEGLFTAGERAYIRQRPLT
jgi:hypothetical protein